jgi:hypothetical protein
MNLLHNRYKSIVSTAFIAILLAFSTLVPVYGQECSPTRLPVNSTGRVTPGDANNVRSEPLLGAALIGTLPAESTFVVLEEARCVDGLLWVRVEAINVIGWTVENANGEYWLEPTCQSPLTVGDSGEIVGTTQRTVYHTPSDNASTNNSIKEGETFIAVEGPICDYEVVWMKI